MKNNVTKIENFTYKSVKQTYSCMGEVIDKNELDTFEYYDEGKFTTKEKKEKIIIRGRKTVCLINHTFNGKTRTFKGTSICGRKDVYNEVKGKKIAFLRAKIAAYEAELKYLIEE